MNAPVEAHFLLTPAAQARAGRGAQSFTTLADCAPYLQPGDVLALPGYAPHRFVVMGRLWEFADGRPPTLSIVLDLADAHPRGQLFAVQKGPAPAG